MLDYLYIVVCACDENGNGSLSYGEMTTDVCKVILEENVTQEEFAEVDANGDGEVTFDEASEWAMSSDRLVSRAASMMQSRAFSNNGRYQKSHNASELKRFFSFLKLKLKPLSESLDVFVILMAMILLILES